MSLWQVKGRSEATKSIGDLKHGKTAHVVASPWAKSDTKVEG